MTDREYSNYLKDAFDQYRKEIHEKINESRKELNIMTLKFTERDIDHTVLLRSYAKWVIKFHTEINKVEERIVDNFLNKSAEL